MAIIWTTPAGSLGSVEERTVQRFVLSATSDAGNITYTVQAGSLPAGLRLRNNEIQGTLGEVRSEKTSRFVIRASDGFDSQDRTFSITVIGADSPFWITREGLLPVGPNSTFFVKDNDKVDFQLEAIDPDIPAGDTIEYYIPYNGGELPPGLSLSKDGRISGFTDPIFSIEYDILGTNYDTNFFDSVPYDVGLRPSNGFDSFEYDETAYDFFEQERFPPRLSRYYQFVVVASDGINEERRTFQIYVVNEDFLRADNTIVKVGTGIFKADNTYVRNPIWITEPDLGTRRANNYITLFLDVFDPPTLPGTITYKFEEINPKYRAFVVEDSPRDTNTIRVKSAPNEKGILTAPKRLEYFSIYSGETFIDSSFGVYQITNVQVLGNDEYLLTVDTPFIKRINNTDIIVGGTKSELPPGMEIDTIIGEAFGRVPFQTRVTTEYEFTVTATANNFEQRSVASTPRTFFIKIIGELESGISWLSEPILGTITPNKDSQLVIKAKSLLRGGNVIFQLDSGNLPPGLTLISSGEIVGKIKPAFSIDQNLSGLTRFFDKYLELDNVVGSFNLGNIITGLTSGSSATVISFDSETKRLYYKDNNLNNPAKFLENETLSIGSGSAKLIVQANDYSVNFDGDSTSFDRDFVFVVKAKDIYNYAESSKTFKISVVTDSSTTYSNIFATPLQKKDKREKWFRFISDSDIFDPEKIYRYGDPAFGVQRDLKMLIYAGIESVRVEKFVQAMSRNHYRKRMRFGDIKKAVAKDPITQEVVYEVVYIEMVDNLQKNGKSITSIVELPDNIRSSVLVSGTQITADTGFDNTSVPTPSAYLISDSDRQRVFPNSIRNMRRRLQLVGDRDRTYLPLWMRSIQPNNFVETGFVNAIPLCYALPNESDNIIANIKNSGFDFRILDFEIDRYQIDSINNIIEDKYLAFPQRGERI